jgi:hypothetical protein
MASPFASGPAGGDDSGVCLDGFGLDVARISRAASVERELRLGEERGHAESQNERKYCDFRIRTPEERGLRTGR